MRVFKHFSQLLFLFGLAMMFAVSGWSARTITSSTLNGVSSVTVAPSNTISAAVNVSITTGNTADQWRSTAWRIGNSGGYTCSDTTNYSGKGAYTNTFNITAPGTIGTYDVSFITYSDNGCTADASATFTMANAVTVNPPSADLSITKTVNNATPGVGDTVIFTLKGTNNGPGASQFKITDVLRSGLSFVSAISNPSTNFSCSQAAGTVTCSGTNSFTSGQSATITLSATVTGAVGTPINNTAQITTNNTATDSNVANNSASVTITPTAATTYTQPTRPFTLRTSMNGRGDIKLIGNSILCMNSNGVCADPGTQANNAFTAMYADLDGDPSTTSSTSADLALPNGSKVLWAGLYWAGVFPNSFATDKAAARTVNLKIPGGSYATVTASQLDYSGSNYQGFADVTSLLNLTNPNGTYYTANLTTKLGTNAYGAWALSIIYQDDNDTLKNLTTYDGFQTMANNNISASVSGFRTPLSGTVASTFFIFAAEGDIAYNGENIQVANKAGTLKNIYNTLNPLNNQFNSNITYKDTAILARNPAYPNTAGIDIDTYDITGFLDLNQTSTTIKLTGGTDQYYVGTFGFATQIYSPTIGNFDKNATVTYASNSSCSIGKDLRGATIHYSMTFQNTGTEAASNVNVYDDFQNNNILTYLDMNQTTIPTAQLLSGTGASTVTCDKNATAIYCNFDRIAINTKYKINFDVKVKSSLSTSNDITLSNTANAHYYNASTGDEITQIATSNMQMAGGLCAVLPVANYRLDECLWSGSMYDVLDSSGNALNGIAVNAPASVTAQTCFGGQFKGASTNTNITIPNNTKLNLSNELSVSVWVNPSSWPASDLRTILSKDDNYEFHLDTNGKVFWWWGTGSFTGATSLPLNQWSHITIIYTSGSQKIYVNGVEDATAAFTGTLPQNALPLYIGVDYNFPSRTFDGMIDEVKVFDRALSASEVANIYDNEAAYKNFDGTVRTCPDCTIPVSPAVNLDAWDTFRSISDRKISTKIVGSGFNLAVTSLDTTLSALKSFNGTVCLQLLTFATNSELARQCKAWSNVTTNTYGPFNILQANDNTKVKLAWRKDDMSGTFSVGNEDNSTIASDYFAIRPASFSVTALNAVAGSDFNITFSAPVFNAPNTPSSSYNETSGTSFDINISEHNTSCTQGIFTPTPTNFSFLNGTKTVTTRYSEVGILDINLSDLSKPCTSRFAKVDCNDADVAGYYNSAIDLPIGSVQKSIGVTPHHFAVNATLSNFDAIHGTNFTYLSNDSNLSAMSVDLNITVTAQTEGNTTTKNYNTLCYAKQTNYTINYTAPTITPSANLSSLNYLETNTSKSGSVSTTATAFKLPNTITDITLVPNTIFGTDINDTNGSAKLSIKINFDRSNSLPVNPFDLNMTSVSATDADSVTGTDTTVGNATFVYGRVHPYDIKTDQNTSVPNPVEIEIYGKNSSHSFLNQKPQNVLYWYRNIDHDSNASGSVLSGSSTPNSLNINTIQNQPNPYNGIHTLFITNTSGTTAKQTVTLQIPSWLVVTPISNTFTYQYFIPKNGTDNLSTSGIPTPGVNSGTFTGSDFGIQQNTHTTQKGIKVFR